jgi:hypothetical protein
MDDWRNEPTTRGHSTLPYAAGGDYYSFVVEEGRLRIIESVRMFCGARKVSGLARRKVLRRCSSFSP